MQNHSTETPSHREVMAKNEAEQADMLGQVQHSRPVDAGLPGIRNPHPGAQWFARSPLGLFIHWGIPSVDGEMDLSWGMIANMGNGKKMSPVEYWKMAERFQAEHFDPKAFLQPAREAGFEYAVLTVKHHDGYTLWPSALTQFGVQSHLQGRDLVREFVEAARECGIRVGLFYSGMDWYFDQEFRSFNYRSQSGRGSSSLPPIADRPDYGIHHEPKVPRQVTAAFRARYAAFNRAQIVELLSHYGPIDVLWFDGGGGDGITIEEIRALQPGIVVNNRGCVQELSGTPVDPMGIFPGDFKTFECEERFPAERPEGWWEENLIWNAPYWGYTRSNEEHYSPLEGLLSLYVQTKAWGGAYLMNVGPRPDGTLPPPYFEGLKRLAAWRKENLAALEGVQPQPEGVAFSVPVTTREDRWYAFALPGKEDPIQLDLSAIGKTPATVTLVRTGEAIPFDCCPPLLTIAIPKEKRTSLPDAVEIVWA